MASNLSKTKLKQSISTTLEDTQAIKNILAGVVNLTPPLYTWLGRLKLLYGVPINYLVPDEGMLPPESIRFFYVDMNWVDALLDGAYSIGRNLSQGDSACNTDTKIDKATVEQANVQLSAHAKKVRANYLGFEDSGAKLEVVSGFILRSKVVRDYKGLGVNAFEKDHVPGSNDPQLMKILRMERLGENSDTLICLLDGDAYRIDLHEAPEHLHYGIDEYTIKDGTITANKVFRKFTKDKDNTVTLGESKEVDLADCFRSTDRRTLKMTALADKIKQEIGATEFDSADMGFEMTEGVGNVQFIRN